MDEPTASTTLSLNLYNSTYLRTVDFQTQIRNLYTMKSNQTSLSPRLPSSNKPLSKDIIHGIFILNGILSLLGLLGNIFVCIIIIRGRKMYTIANLFLMNLAIADICVLVVSYPLWVIQSLLPVSWPFGSALCKIIPTVSDAFYGVSLGCMTTISIHRYRMILHAMDSQLTFFQAKIVIIIIWLVSLASISAPLYPVLLYTESSKTTNVTINNLTSLRTELRKSCNSIWPNWSYERSYQIFLTIVWYVLPLMIILVTFLRIKYYLQKQMAYEWLKGSEHNVLITNHILGIRKALRMLAPVVIVFALLMLPWNVIRISSVFIKLHTIPHIHVYILVAGTMLVANSVVNPFIYYITSKEFRIEFRKQFWLLKRSLGFGDEEEYTIQSDYNGKRYVRRSQSMKESKRGSNATYVSCSKSESAAGYHKISSKSRTDSNLSTTSYKFSNGAPSPDYDELFRENYFHTRDKERDENGFGFISDTCTNHSVPQGSDHLYNIVEEMSVDLDSKDSGFENGNTPPNKNLNCESGENHDISLKNNSCQVAQEEIIRETVL